MLGHHPSAQDSGTAAIAAACPAIWLDAVRELRAWQLYHYQWHRLRQEDGGHRSRRGGSPSPRALAGGTDRAGSVILGCFIDGHMRGAAEIRPLRHGRRAQIALSVESAWQGRGIGTTLMAAAVAAARERGIARLYLGCHILNHRVQRIAERFAARMEFEDCECLAEIVVHRDAIAPGQTGQPQSPGSA
jgi:RimJ/RimL family protein N-acetyltransferase